MKGKKVSKRFISIATLTDFIHIRNTIHQQQQQYRK